MVQKRQRKKQGSTCTTYKLDNYCWMRNVRFWPVKEKQPTLMKTICNWPSTSEHTSQWKSIRYLANGLDNQSKIITNVGKSVLYDQPSHVDQLSANKRWSVGDVSAVTWPTVDRLTADMCRLVIKYTFTQMSAMHLAHYHCLITLWSLTIYTPPIMDLNTYKFM